MTSLGARSSGRGEGRGEGVGETSSDNSFLASDMLITYCKHPLGFLLHFSFLLCCLQFLCRCLRCLLLLLAFLLYLENRAKLFLQLLLVLYSPGGYQLTSAHKGKATKVLCAWQCYHSRYVHVFMMLCAMFIRYKVILAAGQFPDYYICNAVHMLQCI